MWAPLLALFLLQRPDPQAAGLKALEEQRYDAAVQIFTKAVEADPKDYSAHFNLALAFSLSKHDAEAIPEYRKALELKPRLYQAELNLGILLLRQNQGPEALSLFESAVKSKPDQFRPNLYAGEAALAAGQPEKAAQYYTTALQADSKSAAAELGMAHALLKLNRLAEADPHFRKAAELDPSFRDALLELGSVYESQKKMADAIAIYKQFPENAGARERLGELLLESGQAASAIPELEESVRTSPTTANRYALATAYIANKELDKAVPLLDQALQSEPGNTQLRMMYGRALRDQKKYSPAAAQFFRVTQLKPDSSEAWSDLAGMLILLEKDQQAIMALDKVRELGAEKPGHLFFRAIVFDRNKQYRPALEAYEKFLAESNGKSPDEEFKARQRVRILKKDLGQK
jgi:tetratricopeptide (TPR) repeat protein